MPPRRQPTPQPTPVLAPRPTLQPMPIATSVPTRVLTPLPPAQPPRQPKPQPTPVRTPTMHLQSLAPEENAWTHRAYEWHFQLCTKTVNAKLKLYLLSLNSLGEEPFDHVFPLGREL